MRNKKKFFTHLVLWFLIALILFPVVWVVMTSLRRDNAAFSPNIFSTNLTLQNYKDLLMPPRNVPALLSELSNEIQYLPPYDSKDPDHVKKLIEKGVKDLENRINTSEFLIKDAEENYRIVVNKIKEDFPEVKERIISNVKEIISKITEYSGKVKRNEYLKAAVYDVINRGAKGTWYKSIFPDETLSNLEKTWREIKGDLLEREKALFEKKEKLEYEIERLRNSIHQNSLKVQEHLEIIKLLSDDFKKKLEILENTVSDQGKLLNLSDVIMFSKNVQDMIKIYEDLNKLNDTIEEFINKFSGKVQVIPEAYDVAYDAKEEIRSILEDISFNAEKLSKFKKELSNEQERYALLKKQYESVQKEYSTVSKKLAAINEKLKPYVKEAYLTYLFFDLNKKKNSIEKLRFSTVSINKLNIYLKSFRKRLAECRNYGCGLTSELSSLLDNIEWVESYKSLNSSLKKLNTASKNLIGVFRENLKNLEGKWKTFFDISLKGAPTLPNELRDMQRLWSSKYENDVSPALGISIRSVRELMYSGLFRDAKKNLKEMDKALFTYQQIWKKKPKHYFVRWVTNSVIVAGLVAIITTLVTAIAAYPFSRMRFWGRRYGIMTLLLIQMFPAIMYMVALYGMLAFLGKIIPWLGLDTLGGLIFVYLGNIAFNMFLIKGFYDTIPSSLEESAMIDGATRFQTFWKIIVPLARPILAVIVILTFMGTFNEFVLARIILQDVKNYTYALGLWTFSTGPYEMEWGLFTAAALLGMLPMVILFLSMQRFLISGLTKGSVKG